MHTLTELWSWDQPHAQLCDRTGSPWDDSTRRPSHADRRNALRRRCLETEFSRLAATLPMNQKFQHLLKRLTSLVA